jgi:hypothetical protein
MRGHRARELPLARRDRLIVRELPDEVLVYDLERDKAHCLNNTAALVWRHCDGRTSVGELARILSRDAGVTVDEQIVWLALKQLYRDHLLVADVIPPARMSSLSRRQMIRALGIGVGVALPLVTTIIAPTPAQALTCLPSGMGCTGSEQCCSGLCNNGTCA